MSSTRVPISTEEPDATPRVDGAKTGLQESDPALRLGLGRFTVDVAVDDGQLLALVGRGVGSDHDLVALAPGLLLMLVPMADLVDNRTVWETGLWATAA